MENPLERGETRTVGLGTGGSRRRAAEVGAVVLPAGVPGPRAAGRFRKELAPIDSFWAGRYSKHFP